MKLPWPAIEEFVSTHETFTSSELRDVARKNGPDVVCQMRTKGWRVEVVGVAPRKRAQGVAPKLYHVEVKRREYASDASASSTAEGMSCG